MHVAPPTPVTAAAAGHAHSGMLGTARTILQREMAGIEEAVNQHAGCAAATAPDQRSTASSKQQTDKRAVLQRLSWGGAV